MSEPEVGRVWKWLRRRGAYPTESAFQGVFRATIRDIRGGPIATWIVGTLMFTLVGILAGAKAQPSSATALEKSLEGVGAATVFMLMVLVLYALLVQPYRQRKALRGLLANERTAHAASLQEHEENLVAVHRDHREELNSLRSEPISEPHLQQIKRIARSVAESIDHNQPCQFQDPDARITDGRYRQALETHCQGVRENCGRWDQAIQAGGEAFLDLRELITSIVDEEFDDPPWLRHTVCGKVEPYLVHLAEHPQPEPVTMVRLTRGFDLMSHDHLFWEQGAVFCRPDLKDEEIPELAQKLSLLLASLQDSEPFRHLTAVYSDREATRNPAKSSVLSVINRNSLPRNEGCALC